MTFGHLLVPVVALLVGAAGCQRERPIVTRPSVVLISIDTLRRDHVGVYGYERPTTPHVDGLAAEGVTFTGAVAPATSTCPSHATMLTGLSVLQHGAINNGVALSNSTPMLAEVLHAQGYRTAAFVSGGTLKVEQCRGIERGFDHYDEDFRDSARGMRTVGRAIDWIEDNDGEGAPLFVFFHLYDAHFVYKAREGFEDFAVGETPPPRRIDHPRRLNERLRRGEARDGAMQRDFHEWVRRYDASIAYTDAAVGRLLDTLRDRGLYDRALIVFTSDHGETLLERAWVFDHGARVYEEQLRVPLVLHLPRGEAKGRRIEGQVEHRDLMPTVLDALGLDGPPGLQGRSWLATLRGATPPAPRAAFAVARRVPRRLADVSVPLADETSQADPTGLIASVRLPPYKLIDYAPSNPSATRVLFDLSTDPQERNDILQAAPQVARALGEVLQLEWDAARPTPQGEVSEESLEVLRSLGYVE